MAKFLLLKHYRGAPAGTNDVPMDRWEPGEIDAHIQFMNDFAHRLEQSGEFVDRQALAPEGLWGRYDGEGWPPVTDGPFAETKDLIAGWMIIDVESQERAVERPASSRPRRARTASRSGSGSRSGPSWTASWRAATDKMS